MTRRIVTFIIAATLSMSSFAKPIGEYFKAIPASICPFADKAVISEETVDYLSASVTSVSDIQMRFLTNSEGAKVICLVKTFKAPEAESEVTTYDLDWNEIETHKFCLEDISSEASAASKYFEPLLISATLHSASGEITLKVTPVDLSDEEKESIKDIKLQTTLKWNGKTFK